ncbi:MAG TPA: glycosyl hydrolase [Burkholderiaceae bacterium]|nr:glycosyl hydrolase [Burkholderiaceae bacterium]
MQQLSRRAVLGVLMWCATLVAACGGGGGVGASSPAATPEATAPVPPPAAPTEDAVPPPEEAGEPPATGVAIDLPASGGQARQEVLLATSGAEGSYTGTAPGWRVNYWGSPSPQWTAQKEVRPGYVHSGAASQLFRVAHHGGGGAHLTYPYAFAKGKTYRVVLYLRSDVPATVIAKLRRDEPPWEPFATKTVQLGPEWQRIELTGTYTGAVPGTVRIEPVTLGATVWADDLSISEVLHNRMAPYSTQPVPSRLFGLHLIQLGSHSTWPGLGQGMVRLWNTGTTWRDLEPTNDAWDFTRGAGKRLDMYVDHVRRNDPAASILYTLGQTPQWASRTPDVQGLYGPGSSGMPASLEDWRDYVRTLARRYAGRIRYWELWNEPDYQPLFNGTPRDMVEMARVAREELLAADPQNKLVSPGLTAGQGVPWLNDFLAAGGGAYVDIIGFHWYFNTAPESLSAKIDNVRTLMAQYGVGDKELWNTEGGAGCDALIYECSSFVPTAAQHRSVTPRALMIMWARGVSNHNYYFWERQEGVGRLVESDLRTPTEAARAYGEFAGWLKAARLVDGYELDGKVYVFRLDKDGVSHVVLWSATGTIAVNLPQQWAVSRVRTLRGTEAAIPGDRQLSIGIEPVLLKP